ncbi:MAG TPA: zinc-binding alcohol dehydrogenase family protein, partial [Gaiella sp.]|jgi:NADPH2:quinone reductase|nr:zinc-binding alcohol dehydrogenase family protein [Gaiella sp.]
MRAALIRELGSAPELGEIDEPRGDAIVEVLAAPLNPVDLAVASGAYVAGHPPLPYVPGCEAVGRTEDARTVWVFGGGFGLLRDGGMAERAAVGNAVAVEVPDGADPALAAGLGIAGLAGWLPFAWRAPLRGGETVLVLGATGSVGLVAVQAAKLLGASRVVAAGRDAERLEKTAALGADATVQLGAVDDLVTAFREASGGQGPNYVFDGLWSEPLAAALQAAAPGATVVNLGQSAGPTAELASGAVRGKNLNIHGHFAFGVPDEVFAEHYPRLVRHALAGEIQLDVERVPLTDVADAWRRQAAGEATKLVLVP